ncbi:hypothetical protein L915_21359, partial [Phytophthora nicotianae]
MNSSIYGKHLEALLIVLRLQGPVKIERREKLSISFGFQEFGGTRYVVPFVALQPQPFLNI